LPLIKLPLTTDGLVLFYEGGRDNKFIKGGIGLGPGKVVKIFSAIELLIFIPFINVFSF
jgi:hypothetical protein